MPTVFQDRIALFVEGHDEVNFFSAFLSTITSTRIHIEQLEGKSNFAKKMPALKLTPGFDDIRRIALVRDADDNPKAAFDSLCATLESNSLPKPGAPGTFSKRTRPTVGIFIMPNNRDRGMLESLCLDAFPQREIVACAEECIACARQRAGATIKDVAKVQLGMALLASVGQSRLGLAARKGALDFHHSAFTDLREFLKKLVGAAAAT